MCACMAAGDEAERSSQHSDDSYDSDNSDEDTRDEGLGKKCVCVYMFTAWEGLYTACVCVCVSVCGGVCVCVCLGALCNHGLLIVCGVVCVLIVYRKTLQSPAL